MRSSFDVVNAYACIYITLRIDPVHIEYKYTIEYVLGNKQVKET